jgi:Na+/pantothenate symporter
MFNKIKSIIVLAAVIVFTASCSFTAPLTATSNTVGSKVGTSKGTIVLGFYFNQDASIQAAAKSGGITKISTVDFKHTNILGLIITVETIVTGE